MDRPATNVHLPNENVDIVVFWPFDSGLRSSGSTSAPPCELIDGKPIDWSGRGTSHVEHNKADVLPLTRGRFLGYGVNGGVFETICNEVSLTWKQKFCRNKIGDRERRETEIIKKLSHNHIIRLIGTYTHGRFLGLLLWPVAACDLSNLLEDVDWLLRESNKMQVDHKSSDTADEQNEERRARLEALGVWADDTTTARVEAIAYLEQTMGCIASAVAYLHDSDIKHKDLKPSNILLSANGLWIADFGTASDFSVLSSSATENGERGTPKYFAPKVAIYEPSGRSADIFSMGCIFFEIITLCMGHSLAETKQLRANNDNSFHSNIENIRNWLMSDEPATREASDGYILDLVRSMIEVNPETRTAALWVRDFVKVINYRLCDRGNCERSKILFIEKEIMKDKTRPLDEITVEIRVQFQFDDSLDASGTSFALVFEVYPPFVIDQIHFFMHRATVSRTYWAFNKAESLINWDGLFPSHIGIYAGLKQEFYWDEVYARCGPEQTTNRMLPILLKLDQGKQTDTIEKAFKAKILPQNVFDRIEVS